MGPRPTAAPGAHSASVGPPIPKEHGAWAVLYAPLLSVVLISGRVNLALLFFLVAVTALFLAHEPLARLARAGWPRPSRKERADGWWRWAAVELVLTSAAGAVLWLAFALPLMPLLGGITAALFAWHLYRVGRRSERSVSGEVIGIAGLTLTLPGATYVLNGHWPPDTAWLWLLHVLYFTGGIFYVKAYVSGFVGRSDARRWALTSDWYHVGIVLAAGLAAAAGRVPPLAPVALLPALGRALWGLRQKPEALNMRRIGYSEVVSTALFVALLAVSWR